MEVIQGLSNMDFQSSLLRPTMSVHSGTIPWVQPHAVEGDYKKSLPSEEGLNLVLSETDTHSGYGFAFPFHSCSTKTTIHGLIDCVIHGISQR